MPTLEEAENDVITAAVLWRQARIEAVQAASRGEDGEHWTHLSDAEHRLSVAVQDYIDA